MSSLRDNYLRITFSQGVTETFEESAIVKGLVYSFNTTVSALSNGASYELVIATDNQQTLILESDLQFNQEQVDITFSEVESVTGDTVLAQDPFNINQFLEIPPELLAVISDGPTGITNETVLSGPVPQFGVAGQGNSSGPGALSKNDDFLWLAANSVYLWRFTNQSVLDVDLSLTVKIGESADFNLQ